MNQPECFKQHIVNKIHPKYKYSHTYSEEENNFLNNNHPFYISKEVRTDLTGLHSYSIDPETCTDVDDAFSIWTKERDGEQHLYLAIHIADPTQYFSPKDEIFESIYRNNFTHYPSNSKPLHMMPTKILNKSNLFTYNNEEEKPAVSIIFNIDRETFLPKDYEIAFTTITVSKFNKLSYNLQYNEVHVSDMEIPYINVYDFDKIISFGIKISESLREQRDSAIENLVDFNKTQIKYMQNSPHFINNTDSAIKLKIMIEEFAILSNGIIGKYLYDNNKYAFYRSCVLEQNELQLLNEKQRSSDDILKFIITNGIQAYYNKDDGEHNLINTKHYTHFTSPLRRFTDCITHFILKATKLDLEKPFTNEELDTFSHYSNMMNKKERKIQFEDKKSETLWAIYNLIQQSKIINNKVWLCVKFLGYSNGFLNFIIYKVNIKDKTGNLQNSYFTHISYSCRIFNYEHTQYWLDNINIEFPIENVNCITKFDIGILPEFEKIIKNPINK
jgi:ribonuclease R